jgi:RsiW-degrading membrane proteinase PrsW (M82 family)
VSTLGNGEAAVPAATEPPDGEGRGHRLVPQWVGLCLYAGCTVARGIAGFGGGGGALAGLASLPDAPNAPGLWPSVAGSAGAAGSVGSSGPGGALLCPPRRGAAGSPEYEPDLEDELMWRSLRRKVPDLDEWDDFPRRPGEPPDEDAGDGASAASTHGFGDEPGSPDAGDLDRPRPEGGGDAGLDPPPEPDHPADEDDPRSGSDDTGAPGSASTHGFGTEGEPPAGDDAPAGSGGSIHGFGDAPPPDGEGLEPGEAPLRLEARPQPPSVMRLIRTRPCAFMATVGLAVSLVALGFEFAHLRRLANPTGADILRNAGYGAWTIGWMMLVTYTVRTLRLRDVVRFWLLGFFAAAGIVALVGTGVTAAIEPGRLRTAIVVPILEEAVKVVLLGAFLLLAVRGRRREPAITDLVILGFALGAAFAVHEDGLWVRVNVDGFGSGIWGTLFPVFRYDPFVVVGHAGWGALIGLGLGLAWHLRRHRPAWLLAVLAPALAVFDHMSINYVLIDAREGILRGTGWTMRELTGHGSRIAWILLAGFVVGVVVDWLALRRRLAEHPLPAWSTGPGIRARLRALPGARATTLGAILLLGERRARLGFRYALDRAAAGSPHSSGKAAPAEGG